MTSDDVDKLALYRTAKALRECASSWEEEARLLGNIRAIELEQLSAYIMAAMEEADPLLLLDGVPVRFWICPDGCRGGVTWDAAGVAVCDECGLTSKGGGSAG